MEIVLLAGFLSVAVFLYYLMSRLDNDLGRIRSKDRINGTLSFDDRGFKPLCDPVCIGYIQRYKRDYPNLEVTIVFGQQQEILEYLACGKADLAVVSAETQTGLCLETAFVKFEPRTLRLDESGVLLQPIDQMMHKQALVWSKEAPSPLVPEFIRRVGVRNF